MRRSDIKRLRRLHFHVCKLHREGFYLQPPVFKLLKPALWKRYNVEASKVSNDRWRGL